MFQALVHEGLLPFQDLVADCLYGHSPAFLEAVDMCVGVTGLLAIPSETRCWLQRPPTTEKGCRDKGEARAQRVVGDPGSLPSTVATVAGRLPASHWDGRKVSAGTQGPIASALARQRVTLCQDGLAERPGWLGIKRTMGSNPVYSYALSHAPVRPPLRTVVWLSGLRGAVAQGFEEGKTELGMAPYEVRKYVGWHHHRLTTMGAHCFLWPLKLKLGKKSPGADGGATAAVTRSGVGLAELEDGRRPGEHCRAAAGHSPRLAVPEKAARDRRRKRPRSGECRP